MEGEVATGDPHAWKGAKDGSSAVGCMGLPLGRFATDFYCVSAGERLANATNCRFCMCFRRKGLKCWAVRTGMPSGSEGGGQVAHGGVSLICSGALSAGQVFSTVRLVFRGLVTGAKFNLGFTC